MMRKTTKVRLPSFISPMLAKPGGPFDSKEYLFEIKWDGTRTLAFIESGKARLFNRRRVEMTARYPELSLLDCFPDGTVLDGEMVVLQNGKPDFGLLLSREQARSPLRIRLLSQAAPATYIVFDLLYLGHACLMRQSLQQRRRKLDNLVRKHGHGRVILSDAVPGEHGRAYFAEACRSGLEGVVAKRKDSLYLPGRRTSDWIKIKRSEVLECAIIGFEPSGKRDFRSLFLAALQEGQMRFVGKVGTGFDANLRRRLNELLWNSIRPGPWVSCKIRGLWVEPGLYCRVKYLEQTARGELRSPVFLELIAES
jgi:bifunctional non-homologous end joining protein LigD